MNRLDFINNNYKRIAVGKVIADEVPTQGKIREIKALLGTNYDCTIYFDFITEKHYITLWVKKKQDDIRTYIFSLEEMRKLVGLDQEKFAEIWSDLLDANIKFVNALDDLVKSKSPV